MENKTEKSSSDNTTANELLEYKLLEFLQAH